MKVYDCFTFFNELDLLEIRLNELDEIVDYFVIIEGKKTFQNNPKPMYLLENINKFNKFIHKIIRIEIPESEFNDNAWSNEEHSFNSILRGLVNANNEDIIILSTLDEIPKKEVVANVIKSDIRPITLVLYHYYFYLNTLYWLDDKNSYNWNGPVVTTYGLLNKNELYNYSILSRKTYHKIYDAGWHFSFLGDEKNVYNKVHSFSHSECNGFTEEFYKEKIDNLQDVFGRNDVGFHSFQDVSNLPNYVQKNLEKYKKYFRN